MIFNFIDKKIRQSFSNAAISYDVLSGLHREIGRELIAKVKDVEPSQRILDVGMGTGYLTKRLTHFFPEAQVVGIDFAEGMVAYAKKECEGFQIIQADAAALPFHDKTFDLVVSNLAYQWVEDLPSAFSLCHQKLNDKGVFALTVFGHETFKELFESLRESWSKLREGRTFHIRRLATQDQLKDALSRAGFSDIEIDYERINVHFPSMGDLLQWIKNIGANHLPKDIYVGKDLLLQTNEYYERHFKDHLGICATFEIIWVNARKTHITRHLTQDTSSG